MFLVPEVIDDQQHAFVAQDCRELNGDGLQTGHLTGTDEVERFSPDHEFGEQIWRFAQGSPEDAIREGLRDGRVMGERRHDGTFPYTRPALHDGDGRTLTTDACPHFEVLQRARSPDRVAVVAAAKHPLSAW